MFDRINAPGRSVLWRITEGLTDYPGASAEMAARVKQIRAGTANQLVWLVEHPPIFTAGTSAARQDLKNPNGLAVHWTNRGGQWTYHGPGQRVVYVMLDLGSPHGNMPIQDVRAYVAALEEWIIRVLTRLGVRGERRQGRVGIWVVDQSVPRAEAKIAAIGVRVTRWVTWHGFALNVAPDLVHFTGIVPCGLREYGVTSLDELGVDATLDDVDAALLATWSDVFEDLVVQASGPSEVGESL